MSARKQMTRLKWAMFVLTFTFWAVALGLVIQGRAFRGLLVLVPTCICGVAWLDTRGLLLTVPPPKQKAPTL